MVLKIMDPLDYFRQRLAEYPFIPHHFDCEDKNLRAFASNEDFGDWFAQPPGAVGNPYRDEGFYVRDLAQISLEYHPRRIVEIGTSIGIGTLLLRILNPTASILSIDNRSHVPSGDGKEYPVGLLANSHYEQLIYNSTMFHHTNTEFCFIDGDHSFDSVESDSEIAWESRSKDNWVIAWHDYNDRHPGVMRAVDAFVERHKLTLIHPADSSTVWTGSKTPPRHIIEHARSLEPESAAALKRHSNQCEPKPSSSTSETK